VRALSPVAEPHFEHIAELFYDRIREHEGAHDVLVDEAQVERLKRSMVASRRAMPRSPCARAWRATLIII
jgi:hypothetical protein